MSTIFLTALLAFSPLTIDDVPEPAPAEAGLPWVMDIGVAQEMARKEGKDILINFTGSDWCGWCKRLEGEVFSLPGFHETAGKQYIYLYLDFPRSDEAKAKVIDEALNAAKRDQMKVDGFPTIILADSEFRPYARTGYQPGGPEKYLEHIGELRTKGEKVKALIAADSDEKIAELLPEAFAVMTEQNLFGHPDFEKYLGIAEKSDDPELVKQVTQLRATMKLQELLNTEEPDFTALTSFLQKNAEMQGPDVLNALWFCSQWLTENDRKEDAKTFLQRMLADPLVQENERGRKMIEEAIHNIEHETGDGNHDHDGDGKPDH
ncbi:MAG: thioredoxin family protein [Planctomycetota bacterium]